MDAYVDDAPGAPPERLERDHGLPQRLREDGAQAYAGAAGCGLVLDEEGAPPRLGRLHGGLLPGGAAADHPDVDVGHAISATWATMRGPAETKRVTSSGYRPSSGSPGCARTAASAAGEGSAAARASASAN